MTNNIVCSLVEFLDYKRYHLTIKSPIKSLAIADSPFPEIIQDHSIVPFSTDNSGSELLISHCQWFKKYL